MKRLVIQKNDVYNQLTIVHEIGQQRPRKFLCRCSCGNMAEVSLTKLRSGHTKSCGCLHKTQLIERNHVHGQSSSALYKCWIRMKNRCYNVNASDYPDYGGRGITVTAKWKNDFGCFALWALANGYSDSLEIDRIDTNKNYTPSNCRFIRHKKNSQNTRQSKWWIVGDMVHESINDAAEFHNVGVNTIRLWCYGKKYQSGHYTAPLSGCYSLIKYREDGTKNKKPRPKSKK